MTRVLVLLLSWVRDSSWEKKSVQLRDDDDEDLLDVSTRVPKSKQSNKEEVVWAMNIQKCPH